MVLATEEDILAYTLGGDEVLLDAGENKARVARIADVARDDVIATGKNWGIRVETECYYSADHFLGLGGENWTPVEERKRAYYHALRRDLETLCKDIGALSIEEALALYFTDDLVRRYGAPDSDDRVRVRDWLAYVHGEAGKGLDNPAGFLRSRLDSGQWPPRGTARRRS